MRVLGGEVGRMCTKVNMRLIPSMDDMKYIHEMSFVFLFRHLSHIS